jgi:hypothetical protein
MPSIEELIARGEGIVNTRRMGPGVLRQGKKMAGNLLMSKPGIFGIGIGATLGAQSIIRAMAQSQAEAQMEATARLNPANMLPDGPNPEDLERAYLSMQQY